MRVGDYVLAIGNPLGLGQTVTMGIVSAKNRVIDEKLGDVDPRYEDFIQTDAAINQGNSGGPLFNFRGEVIAINSAIINPGVAMNVGFAIPINLARQIADQIRRSGKVARGYLGVGGEDFTLERADADARSLHAGALINVVGRGTPAEAAGLRPNDVIIELGGQRHRELSPPDRRRRAAAPGREGQGRVRCARGNAPDVVVTLGAQGGDVQTGESTFLGAQLRHARPPRVGGDRPARRATASPSIARRSARPGERRDRRGRRPPRARRAARDAGAPQAARDEAGPRRARDADHPARAARFALKL